MLVSGSYLLSRAVSSQVPSAFESLTSVFGMGTGGSSQLSPPDWQGVFGIPSVKHLENRMPFNFETFLHNLARSSCVQIKPSAY